jgi:hypothetical protein
MTDPRPDEHHLLLEDERQRQVLGRVLSDLPMRRAPAALESRVLTALQHRSGFAHWPPAARIAFVALCCALIGWTVFGGAWPEAASSRVLASVSGWSTLWAQPLVATTASAFGLAAWLERMIPPLWIDGVIGAAALLYAVLFGLAAAAYHLYRPPSTTGYPR